MKKSTATLFLLAASTIWGISFVVMKGLLDYLPINYLLAYRFTIGALGLLFVVFKYKKEFTPKAWLHGFLVGLCMYSAFVFQTYGLLFIGSGKNALVTAVYVVIVPFLMWAFKKKRPTLRSVIAGIVCFLGIAVLSLGSITESNASESAKNIRIYSECRADGSHRHYTHPNIGLFICTAYSYSKCIRRRNSCHAAHIYAVLFCSYICMDIRSHI